LINLKSLGTKNDFKIFKHKLSTLKKKKKNRQLLYILWCSGLVWFSNTHLDL